MMFSKKTDIIHYPWEIIHPLEECKFKDDDIFYYSEMYNVMYNIRITNFIDDIHWKHIKKNKSVKIIYENIGEPLRNFIIDDFKQIIDKGIKPSQIYIIVKDKLFRDLLIEFFESYNFKGVNIGINDYWLLKTNVVETKKTKHKFCSFSRHYKPWRLMLYCKLLELDLLKEFKYSFYNGFPYSNSRMISTEILENDLKTKNVFITENINKWIRECPHRLNENNVILNPGTEDEVYETLSQSDFNLVIETHFNRYEVAITEKYKFPVFLTEKTYKAIATRTPFLLVSTPHSLEGLRTLGFKTFHPFIDEKYDSEEDDNKRMDMIIDEIRRICNLPNDEYQKLLSKCQEISQENLLLFKKIINNKNFNKNFLFFKDLINKNSNINATVI